MGAEHAAQDTDVLESQSHLRRLIRRAVSLLDRDRSEAWRCLRDADELLGRESLRATVPARMVAWVEPGCLAAWQTRRVLDYIEERLGAKLAVEDIAAAVALSKSHFARAFKSTLGISPMAYVAARRVERAKCMIIDSAESLADVALSCGFADQSHFSRKFHRAVGVTPGRWRRSSAGTAGGPNEVAQAGALPGRPGIVLRHRVSVSAVG
jgi:AraC family transcriptional regulator